LDLCNRTLRLSLSGLRNSSSKKGQQQQAIVIGEISKSLKVLNFDSCDELVRKGNRS
jgi:hypothetical protein